MHSKVRTANKTQEQLVRPSVLVVYFDLGHHCNSV